MSLLPVPSSSMSRVSRLTHRASPVLLAAVCLAVTGCTGGDLFFNGALAGSALRGVVHGGQQPVTGATISLYAAGTTGYGKGAASLLTTPVTTDSTGSFSITGDYTCPSATSQLYIVATGGNPGLPGNVNNSAIAMMAPLGPCSLFGGHLTLDPNSLITIDEVTTVAAGYALSGFMDPVTSQIGASATNAAGLANAFLTAKNLVDVSTGQARTTTLSGGTSPQSGINGLANVLASCVNSSGSDASCTTLFSATTPSGGTAPTNTLQAILSIATHPTSQASTIAGLNLPASPFQPSGVNATNLIMMVYYSLPSPVEGTSMAIDASGNIWTAYTTSNSNYLNITEYSNSGVLLTSPTGYTGAALSNVYIAFDPAGNPWIAATQFGLVGVVIKLTSNGTVATNFTATGLTSPTGIAIDGDGNVWVPNHTSSTGASSVYKFGNDGTLLSLAGGFTASTLTGQTGGVAIDNAGDAWVSGGSGILTEFSNLGTVLSGTNGYPGGGSQMAFDLFGNLWPGKISPAGVPGSISPFCGLGQTSPPVCMGTNSNAIALDGAGNAWAAVANFDGRFRNFGMAELDNAGNELFGPAGYVNQYDPAYLAVDSSGNVWGTPVFATSFYQSSFMVELIGASTPIVVPSVGVKNQAVGTRP